MKGDDTWGVKRHVVPLRRDGGASENESVDVTISATPLHAVLRSRSHAAVMNTLLCNDGQSAFVMTPVQLKINRIIYSKERENKTISRFCEIFSATLSISRPPQRITRDLWRLRRL